VSYWQERKVNLPAPSELRGRESRRSRLSSVGSKEDFSSLRGGLQASRFRVLLKGLTTLYRGGGKVLAKKITHHYGRDRDARGKRKENDSIGKVSGFSWIYIPSEVVADIRRR